MSIVGQASAGHQVDRVLAEHVKSIVGNERILFWFEASSLLNILGNAAAALLGIGRWLQVSRLGAET